MPRRRYGQTCSVARALDELGERWTLLIVRDLLVAPRRYSDLLEGLPGLGTNLLADRLRRMQQEGIVERTVLRTEPAGHGYRLTAKGRALEPVILALARWALAWGRDAQPEALDRPDWTVVALRATFRPVEAAGVHETYQFRIGDTCFHARVDDGRVRTALGEADAPDLVFDCDPETFRALTRGSLTLEGARAGGQLAVEGSDEALGRLARIFAPPRAEAQLT